VVSTHRLTAWFVTRVYVLPRLDLLRFVLDCLHPARFADSLRYHPLPACVTLVTLILLVTFAVAVSRTFALGCAPDLVYCLLHYAHYRLHATFGLVLLRYRYRLVVAHVDSGVTLRFTFTTPYTCARFAGLHAVYPVYAFTGLPWVTVTVTGLPARLFRSAIAVVCYRCPVLRTVTVSRYHVLHTGCSTVATRIGLRSLPVCYRSARHRIHTTHSLRDYRFSFAVVRVDCRIPVCVRLRWVCWFSLPRLRVLRCCVCWFALRYGCTRLRCRTHLPFDYCYWLRSHTFHTHTCCLDLMRCILRTFGDFTFTLFVLVLLHRWFCCYDYAFAITFVYVYRFYVHILLLLRCVPLILRCSFVQFYVYVYICCLFTMLFWFGVYRPIAGWIALIFGLRAHTFTCYLRLRFRTPRVTHGCVGLIPVAFLLDSHRVYAVYPLRTFRSLRYTHACLCSFYRLDFTLPHHHYGWILRLRVYVYGLLLFILPFTALRYRRAFGYARCTFVAVWLRLFTVPATTFLLLRITRTLFGFSVYHALRCIARICCYVALRVYIRWIWSILHVPHTVYHYVYRLCVWVPFAIRCCCRLHTFTACRLRTFTLHLRTHTLPADVCCYVYHVCYVAYTPLYVALHFAAITFCCVCVAFVYVRCCCRCRYLLYSCCVTYGFILVTLQLPHVYRYTPRLRYVAHFTATLDFVPHPDLHYRAVTFSWLPARVLRWFCYRCVYRLRTRTTLPAVTILPHYVYYVYFTHTFTVTHIHLYVGLQRITAFLFTQFVWFTLPAVIRSHGYVRTGLVWLRLLFGLFILYVPFAAHTLPVYALPGVGVVPHTFPFADCCVARLVTRLRYILIPFALPTFTPHSRSFPFAPLRSRLRVYAHRTTRLRYTFDFRSLLFPRTLILLPAIVLHLRLPRCVYVYIYAFIRLRLRLHYRCCVHWGYSWFPALRLRLPHPGLPILLILVCSTCTYVVTLRLVLPRSRSPTTTVRSGCVIRLRICLFCRVTCARLRFAVTRLRITLRGYGYVVYPFGLHGLVRVWVTVDFPFYATFTHVWLLRVVLPFSVPHGYRLHTAHHTHGLRFTLHSTFGATTSSRFTPAFTHGLVPVYGCTAHSCGSRLVTPHGSACCTCGSPLPGSWWITAHTTPGLLPRFGSTVPHIAPRIRFCLPVSFTVRSCVLRCWLRFAHGLHLAAPRWLPLHLHFACLFVHLVRIGCSCYTLRSGCLPQFALLRITGLLPFYVYGSGGSGLVRLLYPAGCGWLDFALPRALPRLDYRALHHLRFTALPVTRGLHTGLLRLPWFTFPRTYHTGSCTVTHTHRLRSLLVLVPLPVLGLVYVTVGSRGYIRLPSVCGYFGYSSYAV